MEDILKATIETRLKNAFARNDTIMFVNGKYKEGIFIFKAKYYDFMGREHNISGFQSSSGQTVVCIIDTLILPIEIKL